MAYPTVPGPYGFKPLNLIGGQVFAGSTRNIPIQYGFGTNIFYGDVVGIARGFITRTTVTTGGTSTTGAAGNGIIGIFLGCSYTNPVTKQKTFSQYWPANTLAGDAVAIVTDDPDTIFKSAVVTSQGGTTIGSAATAMIGLNIAGSDLSGSINNGDSYNAVLASSAANTGTLPFRVVDLARDSATSTTSTFTSISTATVTCSALPYALPVGTDVGSLDSNGNFVSAGSFVATAAAAGATSFVLNQAPVATLNSTIVFTQYPEILVKINFGQHQYYAGTSIA